MPRLFALPLFSLLDSHLSPSKSCEHVINGSFLMLVPTNIKMIYKSVVRKYHELFVGVN